MLRDVSFKSALPNGSPLLVIVRSGTVERLADTCFREPGHPAAGNFMVWGSFREMLDDTFVLSALTDSILSAILVEGEDLSLKRRSLEIEYPTNIGWSSTMSECFNSEALEAFPLNRRAEALRVRPNYTHVLAPLTRCVTLVYELKFERGRGWVAVMHTVYPGRDIGALRGNVTEMESVVFLGPDHPGEPIEGVYVNHRPAS